MGFEPPRAAVVQPIQGTVWGSGPGEGVQWDQDQDGVRVELTELARSWLGIKRLLSGGAEVGRGTRERRFHGCRV